jgi:hypothetical protein
MCTAVQKETVWQVGEPLGLVEVWDESEDSKAPEKARFICESP